MATSLSRKRPPAQDIRRLAVEAHCTENTVRRWYSGNGAQHHGTRYYLTQAAKRLGLPLPDSEITAGLVKRDDGAVVEPETVAK